MWFISLSSPDVPGAVAHSSISISALHSSERFVSPLLSRDRYRKNLVYPDLCYFGQTQTFLDESSPSVRLFVASRSPVHKSSSLSDGQLLQAGTIDKAAYLQPVGPDLEANESRCGPFPCWSYKWVLSIGICMALVQYVRLDDHLDDSRAGRLWVRAKPAGSSRVLGIKKSHPVIVLAAHRVDPNKQPNMGLSQSELQPRDIHAATATSATVVTGCLASRFCELCAGTVPEQNDSKLVDGLPTHQVLVG